MQNIIDSLKWLRSNAISLIAILSPTLFGIGAWMLTDPVTFWQRAVIAVPFAIVQLVILLVVIVGLAEIS